jgi:hypothetical protein
MISFTSRAETFPIERLAAPRQALAERVLLQILDSEALIRS